ncbi:ATP-binding protein [Undibacterium sp. CY18W]|uniref:histidine kinase n=1 Tax=Undibacterium hunanense TaxID=2762292 RepID=A0ABR6ZXB4_9BURK|nr:sensor histidine kinase [Undibacterium hunanense]MBC3920508.1 ATP-binding protein [Undibacterium hunanense]
MAKATLKKFVPEDKEKFVQFSIESRILKELGERLVSNAEVALTELIKNAYDADAGECRITVSEDQIVIKDTGTGMSYDAFKNKWMRIATGNKADMPHSEKFGRKLTGSKGVGRFAVRFLGRKLKLESVAINEQGKKEKLTAIFDWTKLDESNNILSLKVPYELNSSKEPIGTTLTISELRVAIADKELYAVKSGVLSIASPVYAFINDAPDEIKDYLARDGKRNEDPGFNVLFGDEPNEAEAQEPLAALVLSNFVARTTVDLNNGYLTVHVYHANREGEYIKRRVKVSNSIGCRVYADIRYFPKRAGVFAKKADFNGKDAWSWVRKNSGIKVFDHGFHIRPYGTGDDDWLQLDHDTAHNERKWRSTITEKYFPMDPIDASQPKRNPMVSLPTNYQTVGAVFIETNPGNVDDDEILSPSMDRQGFSSNKGFRGLQNVARFAVEIISLADKKIQLEDEARARNERYLVKQKEIDAVIKEIKSSQSLNREDKERIVGHYTKVRRDIDNLDEYDRSAREGLETMSLLGVVAGFMTHEFQAALMNLEGAAKIIRGLAKKDVELLGHAKSIDESIQYFTGYIDYTRLFVTNLHLDSVKPYRVLPVLQHVISTFSKFQKERHVEVDTSEINKTLVAPLIPVAMYQGIVHNLFTNALKVLLVQPQAEKLICIQAWNEKGKHILQILDNGPGISPDVENRIWDPLYTTTSSENNPLGSGMGLGLPLVKKVVEARKGRIFLTEPPVGFSTCFRVELPLEQK